MGLVFSGVGRLAELAGNSLTVLTFPTSVVLKLLTRVGAVDGRMRQRSFARSRRLIWPAFYDVDAWQENDMSVFVAWY